MLTPSGELELGGDLLATTTLPFPTRCIFIQRWFAAFKSRWAGWHASVFPSAGAVTQAHARRLQLHLEPSLVALSQGFPHTLNLSSCRTQKPTNLAELTKGLHVTAHALETHGGMGRIYALEDPDKVLKVADVRRSWCKYEPPNYELLKARGIPHAHVFATDTRRLDDTAFVVCVLERLDFTMTAFLRAAGRLKYPSKQVVHLLLTLLDLLSTSDLAYCDLSPDNIMFRHLGDGDYAVALIDPQFLVTLPEYRAAMTPHKADAFDRTYLALKIQAVGILDPPVHKFTNAVCDGILGHVPLEKHTRRWLVYDAPVGLFMAYDILRNKHKKKATRQRQGSPRGRGS